MREIVIVITDLFLAPGGDAAAIPRGSVPGMEYTGRFGMRDPLGDGWRAWLARYIGRADLANVALARVAAAALPAEATATARAADAHSSVWIATPLHLMAGLARVHLETHGILRLREAELTVLAEQFACTFGSPVQTLHPLPSGQMLLFTPEMPDCVTTEPARAAAGDLAQALPQGPGGPALRRFGAEIEMWLHALPLNAERARRSELPVTALWLWGSEGGAIGTVQPADATLRVFGSDPWLDGLWRLAGGTGAPLPEALPAEQEGEGLEVWAVALGAALSGAGSGASLADALARVDAHYVSPAVRALRRGRARSVTLLANDTRLTLHRHSYLKRWRRARPRAGGLL